MSGLIQYNKLGWIRADMIAIVTEVSFSFFFIMDYVLKHGAHNLLEVVDSRKKKIINILNSRGLRKIYRASYCN